MIRRLAVLSTSILILSSVGMGQQGPAPGGPGITGLWSRPDKQGFLATRRQNVWGTIAEGILTEVFYPTIDRAQSRDTQIMLVVGQTRLEERKDFVHQVTRYPHSLAFHVTAI